MAGGISSPRKLKKAEVSKLCLDMRIQGMSFRAISDQLMQQYNLKISYATARNYVVGALKETQRLNREEAGHYIELEMERLNIAQAAAMKGLMTGDPQSIQAFVKVCESRRKLLGLDAPVQLQIQQGLQSELSGLLEFLENAVSPAAYSEFMGAIATLEARSSAAATN